MAIAMIVGNNNDQLTENQLNAIDHRPLVLIILGISILLPQLFASTLSSTSIRLDSPAHQLVCSNDNVSQGHGGIYSLARTSEEAIASGSMQNCFGGAPLPTRIAPLFFQPIPINRADPEALMMIPGIGSRLATAIIRQRERGGGIKDQAALVKIEGIGSRKAETIGHYVSFEL